MTQRSKEPDAGKRTAGKAAPKNTGQFGKGNPGKPKGAVNKTTASLKEAILLAAGQVGYDGNGGDGLTGYLRLLAKTEPKAFAGLLGRVIPLQVEGPGPNGEHTVGVRVEFVAANPVS